MNKKNWVIVGILIVCIVVASIVFHYVQNKSEVSDTFILTTSNKNSGVYECYERSFVQSVRKPKEFSLKDYTSDIFIHDTSKDEFASPKYGEYVDARSLEEDEKEPFSTISFDYGGGFYFSDSSILQHSECYNQYSYDKNSKTITIYRTEIDPACENAPSSKTLEFLSFYEQDDNAYLKLKIEGKEIQFVAPIQDIVETNINLFGYYEKDYNCVNQSTKLIEENISINEITKTGNFIIIVDHRISDPIPIKYKTIQKDGKNIAIIYSVGRGVYLELEFGENELIDPIHGNYLKTS